MMKRSHSILSSGHIFNSPRSLDPADTGTLNLKPKVKHSLILNASRNPTSVNVSDSTGSVPITFNLPTTQPCMDSVTNEPGPSSNPVAVTQTYFTSPIRTLKESQKDPDTHDISIHDLVEAYNNLSTTLRDHIQDISSSDVTPPFLTIFNEESQLLSDCLMRDIGRVLPNPFASHHYPDSLADLSFYSEDPPNDDEIQTLTDNNLLCQFALRFVSDIVTFPNVHCNFTHDQLVSLLDYVLQLCKTKTSPIFNIEKHSATAYWILKVQQLPLSILSSLKKEITLAMRNSISHSLGGYIAKLDAFKAVRSILKMHPSCSSWLAELLPSILEHIGSDSPEIAIHAAMACSGFATAKVDTSQSDQFPSEQVAEYVENYVVQETSRRIRSDAEYFLFSFFKTAVENIPRWKGFGLSFAVNVVSCFIVLWDHRIFFSSACIKFAVCVLRECRLQSRPVQKEAWSLLYWAYSRLPLDLEHNGRTGKPSTKERAFRVVSQDGRRRNLVGFLLRADELEAEGKRSEQDVSRAIKVVADLLGDKDAMKRSEGVTILSRMMASIGSPSATRTQMNELLFSRELIDDSILQQPATHIEVTPVRVPIERLAPLTEAEVLCHWEQLSRVWISIAQQDLNSGQEISPEIVQMWQALLLVHGELIPGQEHLTSSSSFASQITSIVTEFTVALDRPERQISYLSFIRKLWSVMKNVFSESWLSSPGESILAALLKCSFTLSDDRVKDLWSHLCGDLISVGIPTFLHAVHFQPSESQEEQEVTRQLWTVLANNGSLGFDAKSWESLLNFLVMPLGVWDLSTTELQLWVRIFEQALDSGVKASQTRQDVIARFLSLCTEPKLTSLKQSPRILRSLLAHLSRSCDSCSSTNLQILSLIDDSLFDSYTTKEEKGCAIDTLRLIGELISNTAESDIVRLLSTAQKSLSVWIADVKGRLKGEEDGELVDILYTRSLDILARLEPSIAILQELTAFLTSVFGRIRGEGPLVFLNFWRSTYHKREDLPKSEIPLAIRENVKAWADVTQDSLGDGIYYDSGSQSLQSFVIPDSQPVPFENVDSLNRGQPLDANTELMIATGVYPERYSDDGAMTPVPQHRFTDPGAQGASGILALQDYNSRYSSDSSKGSVDDDDTSRERSRSPVPIASTSKRSADFDTQGAQMAKRQKLEVPRIDFKPRAGKEKEKNSYEDLELPAKRNSLSKVSVSEPVMRTPSPFFLLQKSPSLPSQSHYEVKEGETSSRIESHSKSFDAQNPEQNSLLSFSYDPHHSNIPLRKSSEDYDLWERNVTSDEVMRVRAELQHPSVVQDDEDKSDDEPEGDEAGDLTDDHDSGDHDILSPLGECPFRSRARQRSQTAPEQSFSSLSIPAARTLRRNRTTPPEGSDGKSASSRAQVDVLQKAYAIVADTGASQVDVQDIMEAKRLLNQINQVLDEQICSKVDSSGHGV